jgi:hypothetical protein
VLLPEAAGQPVVLVAALLVPAVLPPPHAVATAGSSSTARTVRMRVIGVSSS